MLAQGSADDGILDHIGIAVADLAEAAAVYREALGLDVSDCTRCRQNGCAPGSPPWAGRAGAARGDLRESAIARSVEKRGPGIHHIPLRRRRCGAVLARLKSRGVRLIDEAPRAGADARGSP